MADFWADRIELNPTLPTSKDAGTAMPGKTNGTLDSNTTSESASTVDISNDVKEIPCPMNPIGSWGGIENPYPTGMAGTGR